MAEVDEVVSALEVPLAVPEPGDVAPIPEPGVAPATPAVDDDPAVPLRGDDEPLPAIEAVDEPAEGLALLKSGRIRIEFDRKTFTLRRPTFDELLTFVDMLEAADEEVAAIVAENPLKSLRARIEAQKKVVVWVFATFSDKRLDEPFPGWLAGIDSLSYLRQHWQSVPLLPGTA